YSRLCGDCQRRLYTNPLRLLDCKVEACTELRKGAPVIREYLCRECKDHISMVKGYLDTASIKYEEDPYMVRGLDYYTRTTFEFVTDRLGGQNAFAGGGRYDYLVEQFGGKQTPGVGFAAGVERINLIIQENEIKESGIDCFVLHSG